MFGNIMIVGLVITTTILLAFISVYPVNRSHELRPQAVQMFQDKIEETNPEPIETINETAKKAAAERRSAGADTESSVAGTSNEATDPTIKQTIEKVITDDSVKVKIEQQVNSNQPIDNKVKVKVDTGQDPPLVEISTEPQPINCSNDFYDCADFTTCAEAKAVYSACPTDTRQLDPDNNGTPCDGLCTSN